MPGEKFFFDRLDLQSEFHQLRDERSECRARQGRKINGRRAFVEDSLDQFALKPGGRRETYCKVWVSTLQMGTVGML